MAARYAPDAVADTESRAGTPTSLYDEIFRTERQASASSAATGDSALVITQRFTELNSDDDTDAPDAAPDAAPGAAPGAAASGAQRAGAHTATPRPSSSAGQPASDSPPPAPTTETPAASTAEQPAEAPAREPGADPLSPMPAPAPAISLSDAQRLSRTGHASSRRRREAHSGAGSPRSSRRSLPHNVLHALSSQSSDGPGTLLPSLYGYFSNEPAPTHVRPFSSSRLGQPRNLRAQATTSTSPVSATGDSDRSGLYANAALAERILNSGPSIANVAPPGDVPLSPGASAHAAHARLRDAAVLQSHKFAAGALSDRGVAQRRAADVRRTHQFEENSVLAFVWTVDDAKQLAVDIDTDASEHAAWGMRPLFGDERWRIELVHDGGLAVRLTCLTVSALPFEAEMPASVSVALRAPRVPGARVGETLWSATTEHVFSPRSESVVQRTLLSSALTHPRVAQVNAVEVVAQVAAGPAAEAPGAFEMREVDAVPKPLASALAAMVDDGSTGDVMIIVREKGLQQQPSAELAASVGLKSFVQPWQTGASAPIDGDIDDLPIYVRDRVLWAHTPILRARSDFFATMLDSAFSEGSSVEPTGRLRDSKRPFRILRIPDADYVTVYWLLRFLYTNQVHFMHDEDIRAVALDDHWILAQAPGDSRPDWRWRSVTDDDEIDVLHTPQKQPLRPGSSAPMVLDTGNAHALEVGSDAGSGASHPEHSPTVLGKRAGGMHALTNDPHPHPPMLAVPPASALAVYRVAHRYGITELCDTATAHIVAHLTPDNATNYLLCTTLFDQLQSAVQRYMYEHWGEVSTSAAFERCCDEVSAGEWGLTAGRSLVALMRNMPKGSSG